MDTFDLVKSQYEGLVKFLSLSQNVLDSVAILLERVQALLSWQDPYATTLFVIALVVGAVLVWLIGVPWLIALAILSDIRPPRWREPLPSPIDVMFKNLPSHGDRMM